MTELEWYLEIGGKQSGPHAAKEIVDLVRAGRIPATAQVTAARMSGDWVTAKDLVDAYDELYQKTSVPKPSLSEATSIIHKASPVAGSDPDFRAPPRPTEQLEATKNITYNRDDRDQTPDPTDALFQAIQAVREKSASANNNTTVIPRTAPGLSPGSNRSQSRIPPQLIMIATLAAIFGVTLYGITLLLGNKKAETEAKKPLAEAIKKETPSAPPANTLSTAKLLGEGTASGNGAPRRAVSVTRPGLSVAPPIGRQSTGRTSTLERAGGARYRDERDQPIENDVDAAEMPERAERTELPVRPDRGAEMESSAEGQAPSSSAPVDPSQVPLDKPMPDMGNNPGIESNQ